METSEKCAFFSENFAVNLYRVRVVARVLLFFLLILCLMVQIHIVLLD